MPFTCRIGDSFFLPDTGGRHRYVILTNPNSDGKIVLVNFTDSKNVESPVIFHPKDDIRLFNKRTGVYYAWAKLVLAANLTESIIDRWIFCQSDIIKEIVRGAFQSQHTPIEILREISAQYPAEHKKYCTWDYLV